MKKSKLRKKQILSAVLSAALLTNSVQLAGIADSPVYDDGTYTGTASGFNVSI